MLSHVRVKRVFTLGMRKIIWVKSRILKRMLNRYIHVQKNDLARGKEYGGCEISNLAKK